MSVASQQERVIDMTIQGTETGPGNAPLDYYILRLAQVQASCGVRARDDIRDAHGVRLIRAGQAIDRQAADRVLDFQRAFGQALPTPVDFSVDFERCIDGSQLFHKTYALFGKYADLMAVHKQVMHDDTLSELTVEAQYPTFVWQKLTVLEQQTPERFNEALFCAWFAALVARQLKLDAGQVRAAYWAGLVRDIGFLSIPAEVLDKRGPLSPADWRSIQSHVEFSWQCLEKSGQIPPAVVRAVAEHHERHDGSGYPTRRRAEQLSQLGLVVGLADTLQAIRFKQFAQAKRCLYDAIPYLQMSAGAHSAAVANAAVMVLRQSGLSTTRLNPCPTVSQYAYQIMVRAQNLLKQIGYLDQILQTLQMLPLIGQGKALLQGAAQVQAMIVSSGLTRDELIQWLQSLQGQENDDILAELNELDLMLNELRWHVQKLTQNIDAFFEASTSGKTHAEAHKSVANAADGLRDTLAQG